MRATPQANFQGPENLAGAVGPRADLAKRDMVSVSGRGKLELPLVRVKSLFEFPEIQGSKKVNSRPRATFGPWNFSKLGQIWLNLAKFGLNFREIL